ncbi:hypothetical protein VPHK460_0153 [Vibrio phage K460]
MRKETAHVVVRRSFVQNKLEKLHFQYQIEK